MMDLPADRKLMIMRAEPVVVAGALDATIRGRAGCLLRLLILQDGKVVRKEEIADLNDTAAGYAQGKIRDLRNQLRRVPPATDLIKTDETIGYHADTSGWAVDAAEFRNAIERLDGRFDPDSDKPIHEGEAREAVQQLTAALDLWHANPGVGLEAFPFENKFAALKLKAERRRIKARLWTRDQDEIREAINYLEALARQDDVEEWVWRLLLLAHHALVHHGSLSRTVGEMETYYRGSVPEPLEKLARSVMPGGNIQNPFRATAALPQPPSDPSTRPVPPNLDDLQLLHLCKTIGITPYSQLKLRGTQLEPLPCILRTRTRLYFSGVLASKWVNETRVRQELKNLLTRLDENGGEAKFLMINPTSEAFERLKKLRRGEIDLSSVSHFRRLMKEHRSLEVRVFDHLPAFRIIVIDDDVVSFSSYRLAAEAYASTDRGLASPHVALDPLAPYPLSEAFELLFKEMWAKAHDLRIIKDGVE
jgi:hypothetical protein